MKITSSQNKWIKEVRKLNNKKYRRSSGLFVAEGVRFIKSLMELDALIEAILYDENILNDEANLQMIINNVHSSSNTQILEVSSEIINKLFDTKTPQGVLAIVHQKKSTLKEILSYQKPIFILDRLQDAGNLGTLIRTADCAGIGGIIMLSGSVDIYNNKVLRSTMGGIYSLPIVEDMHWNDVKLQLIQSGYNIFAADVNATNSIYDVSYTNKTAVIIGNEANGISKHIVEDADIHIVTIPNVGRMESLNAAVAGSVIMYEILRQNSDQ